MTVADKSERFEKSAGEFDSGGSKEAFDEALRRLARRQPIDEKLTRSQQPKG